jgi:hypothetical protein
MWLSPHWQDFTPVTCANLCVAPMDIEMFNGGNFSPGHALLKITI